MMKLRFSQYYILDIILNQNYFSSFLLYLKCFLFFFKNIVYTVILLYYFFFFKNIVLLCYYIIKLLTTVLRSFCIQFE